jgi:hypothetical protein
MPEQSNPAHSACECGHPWFDHDSRGCGIDSFLTGPCSCKTVGPPCAHCGHTASEHGAHSGLCGVDGCECETFVGTGPQPWEVARG